MRSSEEEKRVNWIEKAERRYSTVTVSEYSVLAWTGGTGAVLTVETVVKRARYHGLHDLLTKPTVGWVCADF